MRKLIVPFLFMPALVLAQQSLTLPKLPVSLMDDWDSVKTTEKKQPEPSSKANIDRSLKVNTDVPSKADVTLPVVDLKGSEKGGVTVDKQILSNEIILTPGTVDVQPIAMGHLNRFEMPFDNPQIRTVSSADIQVNGRVVYILSDSPGVISLYVTTPEEDLALSLALLPQKIPPRDVKVRIGTPPEMQNSGTIGQQNPLAKKTEKAADYVGSIRSILAEISQGKVPRGYGFQKMNNPNAKDIHHCYLDGLDITPKQRMDGHRYLITVSKVTNISPRVVEIDERLCYRQGVLGVAAWPEVVLNPGQSTELYLVHRREIFKPSYDGDMRPSVLD